MGEIVNVGAESSSQPGTKQATLPLSFSNANHCRKKLIRRRERDSSQPLRQSFQAAFLLMNIWLGGESYVWVRHLETGSAVSPWLHPAGIDGWLPISGLLNLKYWLLTGGVPDIHPAALFLFLAFLGISLLFRKSFCSWLCPMGTISEYLWRAGRRILRRNFQVPRWLDIPIRGLKYLLLGFFVWAVVEMSVEEIAEFMHSPFGIIADVKMLDFFRFLSLTGLIVIGILVVASLLIQNFWCRYLCPYGALFGLASLLSPVFIRREPEACIDCAKCAKACPSLLPVDKLVTVRSAECTGCLACVSVCPVEDALSLALSQAHTLRAKKRRIPAWALAMGIALVFFGMVGYAKLTDHWKSNVTNAEYQRLVPHADEAQHPMGY
jgi:polyferredoxin